MIYQINGFQNGFFVRLGWLISCEDFKGAVSRNVSKFKQWDASPNIKITWKQGIINKANTKGRTDGQTWRRLKHLQLWFLIVSLNVFQSSVFLFASFDIILVCFTRSCNFVIHKDVFIIIIRHTIIQNEFQII